MTLWGGRFKSNLDPAAWQLNASLNIDQRLSLQDVRGSIAWAIALQEAGILTPEEGEQIQAGLLAIQTEFEQASFVFQESDEDIHTAVERRLVELIGPAGGKLHTGRSRNDQVATDLRLWLLEHLPGLDAALAGLQLVLIERAENDAHVIMPGYTHLQRAQPILLSHWWLSHFWPLQRDRQRLGTLSAQTAVLPLGSSALAGTAFPIDRAALATELGFDHPSPNSLDAVADRDFVAEFLFCAALIGVHLSRLAESIVVFTSSEFGFFELLDAFATGSSLMPQKKNPDVFELVRGKTGALLGGLAGLMATLKGLPSIYDKDLQEDKQPTFTSYDILMSLLPVLAKAIHTLTVYPERMRAAIDSTMLATDLADYLVQRGIPFRQAHTLVGQVVQYARDHAKALDALEMEELRAFSPLIGPDVLEVFDPFRSIAQRSAVGGTAPEAVAAQLQQAKEVCSQSYQTVFRAPPTSNG